MLTASMCNNLPSKLDTFHVLQYYNWLMGQCVARFGKPDTAKAHESNPFPGLVSVLLQQR